MSSGDSRDSFSRSQAYRRLKAGDLLNSLRQRKMDSKAGDAVRAAVCGMRIAGSFHPWLARHSRMIKREDLMIELQPCLHPAVPQQQLSLVRQTNPRAFYMIISVGRSVASPARLTSRSSVSKHSQPLSLIIVGKSSWAYVLPLLPSQQLYYSTHSPTMSAPSTANPAWTEHNLFVQELC